MYFNGTNEEIRSRIYGFFLSVRYICIDRHTDELNVLVTRLIENHYCSEVYCSEAATVSAL